MAQPLYFLPNIFQAQLAPSGKFIRSILASRGLAETFVDVDGPATDASAVDVTGSGPHGKSGCIICAQRASDGGLPEKLGYAEGQIWEQVAPEVWMCADGVKPEDILRKNIVAAYDVELGDGNQYMIPAVRRASGSTDLPRNFYIDHDGSFCQVVKLSHKPIYDEAKDIHEWIAKKINIDERRGFELATKIVGINYRFSAVESRLIPLITSVNWPLILGMAIDPGH